MAAGQQWLIAPAQPLVERLGREFFRTIPAQPGVYVMRDANGVVVYVGKAKNLRQRLQAIAWPTPSACPADTCVSCAKSPALTLTFAATNPPRSPAKPNCSSS